MIKKAIDILWKQKPSDTWTDPDPDDLNIDNAYKTRWIWYLKGVRSLYVRHFGLVSKP